MLESVVKFILLEALRKKMV